MITTSFLSSDAFCTMLVRCRINQHGVYVTMRLLITWSDRGSAGPKPAHHAARPRTDRGPVARLIQQPDIGLYDQAWVLTTPSGLPLAQGLVDDLRPSSPNVRLVPLPVSDPTDHHQLFGALGPLLDTLPRPADLDVVLSAGTPQTQTLWVLLQMAGLLDFGGRTRLLQVIPDAFVPVPHPKPWREVRLDIEDFPEVRALRAELHRLRAALHADATGIVGAGVAITRLKRQLARVAPSEVPVLVLGETGTGKELVARAVHGLSRRAAGPFVAESCASLAEGVLQSELFGHERGAFTGAVARRKGLFELAHGGTLFLDEVGELPPRVQALLLRVLQEGELRRVGGERTVGVDVRVVAATHRDLAAMVAEGTFRQDLYYRLRGATLRVPPLRERPEDLGPLVQHFLGELGHTRLKLGPGVQDRLTAWDWPGNVRELRAEVVRWTVFCDARVEVADLSPELRDTTVGAATSGAPPADHLRPLATQVAELEANAILAALEHLDGNKSAAARLLAIDRNTLKRKLRALP